MGGITKEKIEWAREILCLDNVTTYNEVLQKWRALVKKAHPDMGGDNDRIRDVNEAKNILLKFIRNCPCKLEAGNESDWWDKRFGKLWEE